MDFVGLVDVNRDIVYHIYIPNKYYLLKIGCIGNTDQLPIRHFPCGYKGCIENAAEEMRLKIKHNAPSRLKCLFVCNERNVKYWYNYFNKRNQGIRPIVYQLEVTGKIFWSYAELMQPSVYWNHNILLNLQEHEGVFEGEYKVICIRNSHDF